MLHHDVSRAAMPSKCRRSTTGKWRPDCVGEDRPPDMGRHLRPATGGRTVLPKLIFLLSAAGSHWDVRQLMMLSVICCWLTASASLFADDQVLAGCHRRRVFPGSADDFTPAVLRTLDFRFRFPSFVPALSRGRTGRGQGRTRLGGNEVCFADCWRSREQLHVSERFAGVGTHLSGASPHAHACRTGGAGSLRGSLAGLCVAAYF